MSLDAVLEHENESQPEAVWTNESAPEDEEQARMYAGEGDYAQIHRKLENTGLLGSQMERVAHEYEYIFKANPEVMSERDLEMFTILELYDKGTARHCAETYRIAREKIEKPLTTSRERLGKLFNEEYVSLGEFFRACLLHDIGKVEIPRFIIQHPMNNHEMDMLLRDLVVEHDPGIMARLEQEGGILPEVKTVEELESYLKEHGLRSVHFVPAKFVLSEEQVCELKERGIDPNLSLMDIIRTHEASSERILFESGRLVESKLAGRHHNYLHQAPYYPASSGALHMSVDLEELLHIADVQQALSGDRPYQKGNSPLSRVRVLRIIMDEARRGRIREDVAYLWVEDDLNRYLNHGKPVLSEEDTRDIEYIEKELGYIRTRLDEDAMQDRWLNAA